MVQKTPAVIFGETLLMRTPCLSIAPRPSRRQGFMTATGRRVLRAWRAGLCVCGLLLLPTAVQAAVVLQYHHISDTTPAATSTSPALFRQHLDHLQAHGYEVVALPELLNSHPAAGHDRSKRVAITFDDGYVSIYTEAFPELKKRGWPFTVFINTKPHDEGWKEFASWSQLREMAKHGATIANHTVHHDHLVRRLPGESDRQWRQRIKEEVTQAEKRIKTETGQSHRLLAYPFGEYDAQLEKLLDAMGYTAFGQHSGPLDRIHSRQALPRFPFGGNYGELSDFALKAATLPMPLESVTLVGVDREGVDRTTTVDPLLPKGHYQPQLLLTVATAELAKNINCFAGGQGRLQTVVDNTSVTVKLHKPLAAGRSRINCTAAAGEGRFYWFTQPFLHPDEQGNWPKE